MGSGKALRSNTGSEPTSRGRPSRRTNSRNHSDGQGSCHTLPTLAAGNFAAAFQKALSDVHGTLDRHEREMVHLSEANQLNMTMTRSISDSTTHACKDLLVRLEGLEVELKSLSFKMKDMDQRPPQPSGPPQEASAAAPPSSFTSTLGIRQATCWLERCRA